MPNELLIPFGICLSDFTVWLLAILSSVSMRHLGCLVEKARKLPLKNDTNDLPGISVIVVSHYIISCSQIRSQSFNARYDGHCS